MNGRFARCAAAALCAALLSGASQAAPPKRFVYLSDIAPSIAQDMRYATAHNFTGKPVPGYGAAECLLQREAAQALSYAQEKAQKQGLSLKVFDCYRPARAVRAFMAWVAAPDDGATKSFYPHLPKSALAPDYIAPQSTHSTGQTVDITLVRAREPEKAPAPAPANCMLSGPGESVDMGTAFDCFDPKANTDSPLIAPDQKKARAHLKAIMAEAGFDGYGAEWWHFSFRGAKDKTRYDFPIEPHP
jgi:D-alanyl-D-alanine dipeptidase